MKKKKNHRPKNGCPAPGRTSGIYYSTNSIYYSVLTVGISSTLGTKLSNYVNNNDTLLREKIEGYFMFTSRNVFTSSDPDWFPIVNLLIAFNGL